MEAWAYFVEAFAKVKEGDGTLLDNMLIYASTDHVLRPHPFARWHSDVHRRPRRRAVKTGLHIDGAGSPGARVGYTAMKVFGLDVGLLGHAEQQDLARKSARSWLESTRRACD